MSYNKLIRYGNFSELYEYEKTPNKFGRKYQKLRNGSTVKRVGKDRADLLQRQSDVIKRRDNARRSSLFFKRLVSANLGVNQNPLLVTLTYAENQQDLGQGHSDFNTFARRIRSFYGKNVRYIAVPEFQKRGAVHFHALFWGLPSKQLASTERYTRLFAKTWGLGFVDLFATDGDIKLAGYLAKYMAKSFVDTRLGYSKSYITSRNILRPIVEKDVLIEPLFIGGLKTDIDLSTATLLQDKIYMTQWLGKGRYRYYQLNN